ncbi:MAG: PA14 domain-containing protein, partial [Chloroflexota bacterium]
WRGEYFNNTALSGSPVLTRNDQAINFNWGSSSPSPNLVDNDNFSVRWTQTVGLAAGTYQFNVTVDDGVRLYVNDQLIIDRWTTSPGLVSGQIALPGGDTRIRLEYFELTGLGQVRLDWQAVSESSAAPSAPSAPSAASASEGSAVLRNARVLTLRSGPGITFNQIDYITRGMEVSLIGKDSGNFWIKVELPNGRIGWASSRYLSSPTSFDSLPIVQ